MVLLVICLDVGSIPTRSTKQFIMKKLKKVLSLGLIMYNTSLISKDQFINTICNQVQTIKLIYFVRGLFIGIILMEIIKYLL